MSYTEIYRKQVKDDRGNDFREHHPPARNREDVHVRRQRYNISETGDSFLKGYGNDVDFVTPTSDIQTLISAKRTHVPTISDTNVNGSIRTIDTPTDPSKLSTADRKKLLLKRISQLEETDQYIDNLQTEMAATARQNSQSGHASSVNSVHRTPSPRYDMKAGLSDRTLLNSPNNFRPASQIRVRSRENRLDTERHLRAPNDLGNTLSETYTVSSKPPVYKTSSIPGNDIINGDYTNYRYLTDIKTRNVQNIRKVDRKYRTSILNKAEKLLNERKRRQLPSTGEESQRTLQRRLSRNRTYTKRPLSRSPISDSDIVEVPETLDSAPSSAILPRRWKSRRSDIPSAAQSEIPILYSDEEGEYPEPRPLTDTDRSRYPNYRRYEDDGEHMRVNYRDPAHKKVGRTCGALVKFFRNGDSDFKGLPLTVNRNFRNLETLLVYLNDKVPTSTGVHYIFKWPEGTEIKSVTEFQNRCVYIVSSTHKLVTNVNYGQSREDYWSNKKPSAGRLRKNELELYKKPPSPRESPVRNSPLIVTIINNLSRDKREKVILNPQTQQTFEKWLEDISNPDMPVYALFSEKPPHVEINSFSALFRELRTHSNFLAVGEEGLPAEVAKKRQAPSSNSSTDSIHEARNRKKKLAKQQEMGQIYENGRAQSPTSTAMSRYDYGPRYLPGTRGRSKDARRNIRDSVEIEIDGNVREFIPPSFVDPEDDGRKPDKNLKCEWVYGFRGRDARHNLLVLPETGELVYFVASVVVLYNKERDTQRHYIKHNEEITCMTIHPNQYLIATGQMHGKGPEHASHIRIWHGVNLSTYSVIGVGVFYGEILSIGFSNDGTGNFMCVIDGSEKHVLSVWEWQTEKLVARTTTSTDPVHCACFYPDGKNNSILITYGARHIYFWKIFYDVARRKEAKILRDRNSGIFEDRNFADHLIDEIPKSINCLVFLASGDVVTGDSSGNLLVWDRDTSDAFTCRYAIQAHQGSVASVCLLEDGTLFSASGSEVKAWDTNSNFRAVKTRQIPQEAGGIRSLVTQTPGGIDGKLYIGTTRSAILDGSLQLKFRYIVQGHSDGILGVVPHPFEPTFISAGMDQIVYKWSLVTHKVTWRSKVEAPCTSAAVDQRHELIAVGMSDGTFTVLNSYNGMHITTVNVGAEPIGCLAFSPDGCNLALGTNDGLVIVFTVHDRGQAFRKVTPPLTGHTSGVAHVDWSTDGRCIQSSSYTHELLFWDIDGMQQIRMHRLMRDVDWFTSTCHVQYGLIGPWSNLEKGETVKVVNRSNFRDTVITGDSKGRIRLYKYPCSKEKADFRGVRVYSSDVTAACFTPDTRTVITCGGHDAAMVQWTLVDE
ncbi:echinoderm microtubule-associated protein-like 1 isoform X3 [Mya arenaria]|uniref:echinoderm microtubule-associated protein-like 1 isoform X3 n=1 Tax=Mya arenaria TaxID=6604 RepID=UPI0022E43068|nr:echinoderm microtubule-associated protein-like 1 isoform X3 [Mya arenaria]